MSGNGCARGNGCALFLPRRLLSVPAALCLPMPRAAPRRRAGPAADARGEELRALERQLDRVEKGLLDVFEPAHVVPARRGNPRV